MKIITNSLKILNNLQIIPKLLKINKFNKIFFKNCIMYKIFAQMKSQWNKNIQINRLCNIFPIQMRLMHDLTILFNLYNIIYILIFHYKIYGIITITNLE